jgi:nitric oxide dioxygenase
LHDAIEEGHRVQVGPPCGEFTINPDNADGRPVVLLAGGIGVTPLLSMAKSIVHTNPNAPIFFLQAARNSGVHAFADEIRNLASLSSNMHVKVLYDDPLAGDVEGQKCDGVGFVSTELLRQWTPFADADFYFCGPKPFMQKVHACLQELGVDETRVRYEFFGPKEELQPA